jgi:hypothetical protein
MHETTTFFLHNRITGWVSRLIDRATGWERYERAKAEHAAAVRAEEDAWRAAHPDLVARGIPPPPTPLSVIFISFRF